MKRRNGYIPMVSTGSIFNLSKYSKVDGNLIGFGGITYSIKKVKTGNETTSNWLLKIEDWICV